jgi:hypothetical protein
MKCTSWVVDQVFFVRPCLVQSSSFYNFGVVFNFGVVLSDQVEQRVIFLYSSIFSILVLFSLCTFDLCLF